MAKSVKGFLASDGRFFEDQWECDRYNHQQKLIELCESHNINPENFMALVNSWHEPIRSYLDADSKCKSRQANGAAPTFEQPEEPVSQDEDDQAHTQVRDKDAPGFLQQSFGVDK